MLKTFLLTLIASLFLIVGDAKADSKKADAEWGEQTGTIISIDKAAKTFVCRWGDKDYLYKTKADTGYRLEGGKGSFSDIKIGVRVNIGYSKVGDERIVDWVSIVKR